MTDPLLRHLLYEAVDLTEQHGLTAEAALDRALDELSDLTPERRETLRASALTGLPYLVKPPRSGSMTTKEIHMEAGLLGGRVQRGEITIEDAVQKLLDTEPDVVILRKAVHALANNPRVYMPNGWPPYQIANTVLERLGG